MRAKGVVEGEGEERAAKTSERSKEARFEPLENL